MKLLAIEVVVAVFIGILKLAEVGVTPTWSWWVLLVPFTPSAVINVLFWLVAGVFYLFVKNKKSQLHGKPLDGSRENWIQEVLRKRRAKKHEKMLAKYQ